MDSSDSLDARIWVIFRFLSPKDHLFFKVNSKKIKKYILIWKNIFLGYLVFSKKKGENMKNA